MSPRVHLQNYADKPVLLIEVPRSDRPVGTSAGIFVRRAMGADGKPTCLPFFHHEMVSCEAAFGRLDYTALPVSGTTWDDFDPLEFHRVKRRVAFITKVTSVISRQQYIALSGCLRLTCGRVGLSRFKLKRW